MGIRVDNPNFIVQDETHQLHNELIKQLEAQVIAMQTRTYRFRPGALDAIARSRNFTTDQQLALYVGVKPEHLPLLHAGAEVSERLAVRVSALQGDEYYTSAWFDLVEDRAAA